MIYFNVYGVAFSKPINEVDYVSLNPSIESIMCYYRRQTPSIIIENPSPQEKKEPFGPPNIKEDSPIVKAPPKPKRGKGSLDFNLK
jgi:hypothetical protein